MAPEVTSLLIGRAPPFRPATLAGYTRHKIKGQVRMRSTQCVHVYVCTCVRACVVVVVCVWGGGGGGSRSPAGRVNW
jgi:hypothetical protein